MSNHLKNQILHPTPDRDLEYELHIYGECSGDPLDCPYCNPPDPIPIDPPCTEAPGNKANDEWLKSSAPSVPLSLEGIQASLVAIHAMTNYS